MQRIWIILAFVAVFLSMAYNLTFQNQKNGKRSAEDTMELIFKIEDKITAFGKIRDRKAAEKLLEKVAPSKIIEEFFEDSRDSVKYKAVKIGDQWWMAENLKYKQGVAACYKNDSTICKEYGRLYSWDEAEEACPPGWHLPQVSEVETLLKNVGGVQDEEKKFIWHNAGYFLKSKTGWQDYDEGVSGNGFDAFGFSALAAGRFGDDVLGFYYLNVGACFIVSRKNAPNRFNMLSMGFDSGNATLFSDDGSSRNGGGVLGHMDKDRYSVRCVKD